MNGGRDGRIVRRARRRAAKMSRPTLFDSRLSQAVRDSDLPRLRILFAELPDHIQSYTPFAGSTWLGYAAGDSSLDIVRYLVSIGISVNDGDKRDGRRPICDAARAGKSDIVQFLLNNGAILDTHKSICNPLFAAIAAHSLECARLLIDAGIDTRVRYDTPTMSDMDAVAFAMMEGPHDIARLIALHNADGDVEAAERAMAEGLAVARRNTRPVPPGEDYAPS